MKNITITILISLGAMQVQAQDVISRFFSSQAQDDSYTHVSMTSRMFSLFTDLEMESEEDQQIVEAIKKLKGLKILAKSDTQDGMKLYQSALKKIPTGEFDELMSLRDEDKDMKFMIKERDGKISELVMVMGGEKDFFILTLFGEIDLKQIAKISRAMDIDGLDKLEKIDKNKGN